MKHVQFITMIEKKNKGIYGNATAEEVKELKEEGIETEIIPWVNESDN